MGRGGGDSLLMSLTGTANYRCGKCRGRGHNARTCGRPSLSQPPKSAATLEGARTRTQQPVKLAKVRQIKTAPGVSSSWLVG